MRLVTWQFRDVVHLQLVMKKMRTKLHKIVSKQQGFLQTPIENAVVAPSRAAWMKDGVAELLGEFATQGILGPEGPEIRSVKILCVTAENSGEQLLSAKHSIGLKNLVQIVNKTIFAEQIAETRFLGRALKPEGLAAEGDSEDECSTGAEKPAIRVFFKVKKAAARTEGEESFAGFFGLNRKIFGKLGQLKAEEVKKVEKVEEFQNLIKKLRSLGLTAQYQVTHLF